jgi:Trk K+ transport system NAD-binding subunit
MVARTSTNTAGKMLPLIATIGRWLRSSKRARVLFVGNDPRLRLLAAELGAANKPVSWVKLNSDGSDAVSPGVNLVHGTEPWEETLLRAGAQESTCLIASSTDTDLNQKLCQLARHKFGVPNAIMRLCLVSGVTSWARLTDLGMSRTEWRDVLRTACADGSPSRLIQQLSKLSDRDRIVDLELRSPVFVGRTINELQLEGCEVLGVTRKGVLLPAFDLTHVELNDVVTVVGPTEIVNKIRESFTSL